ncbi:OprD family outer membrane porin [Sulfurimonas sp. HSL3-7]|uniref:OprD family outer membrane porin n=1 Tax=Sulfonitrofixus jiaomeiensis TaxID=3131938 RepID=UPI0031F95EB4
MKKTIILSGLLAATLYGAESLDSWFSEGKAHGNIKYYFIETNKEHSASGLESSAYANSVGGQLGYITGSLYGFTLGATFMTTNPFALPDSVDTSIIGRDNAVQKGLPAGDPVAQEGFSVLGEAYLDYQYQGVDVWYGRKTIKTPLVNAKEVRMLPSTIEGGDFSYAFENGIKIGGGYLDKFKQRTSSRFVNIVEHALGDKTEEITGHRSGNVLPSYFEWHDAHHAVRLYDYYSKDFMNTTYFDAVHNHQVNEALSWTAAVQGMHQHGVGYSRGAMDADTAAYGGKINSRFFGLKAGVNYHESSFLVAYTNVLGSRSNEHNSLVMPWDGTPLFTDMITSNDLFTSNYGKGLTSSGGYIAGTSGYKAAYTQKYDFTGVKGFKSVLSYAYYDNSNFTDAQQDINLVLAYGIGKFDLALKGIWVSNNAGNTAADADIKAGDAGASISQIDKLTQYRVIANYKF